MLVYAGVYNLKCYFCSLPNGKYTKQHLLEPLNKLFSRAAIKHIMKGNGRAIPPTIAWELLWTRCEAIKILVKRILSVYPSMTKLQKTCWYWLDVQCKWACDSLTGTAGWNSSGWAREWQVIGTNIDQMTLIPSTGAELLLQLWHAPCGEGAMASCLGTQPTAPFCSLAQLCYGSLQSLIPRWLSRFTPQT